MMHYTYIYYFSHYQRLDTFVLQVLILSPDIVFITNSLEFDKYFFVAVLYQFSLLSDD